MSKRYATYFAREQGASIDDNDVVIEGDVFDNEGYEGVAIAILAASVHNSRQPLILNVPNRGAVEGLRDDDVVEVTCVVDEHGAHPVAQGEMPDGSLGLVQQVKLHERLVVRAASEGSYESALRALLVHPLVGSYPVARTILDAYVERLGSLLPELS